MKILKEVTFTNNYRITLEELNGKFMVTNLEICAAVNRDWFTDIEAAEQQFETYMNQRIKAGYHLSIRSKLDLMMVGKG